MLECRSVKRDHLRALFRLDVYPAQSKLVAPNSATLAQVAYETGSEVWGLWDGDSPVGLLAMIDPVKHLWPEKGDDLQAAYIWRLMIDKTHQRKGYGRAAIKLAIAQTKVWALPRVSLTVLENSPGSALTFYEKQGFVKTGRVIDGETELILDA